MSWWHLPSYVSRLRTTCSVKWMKLVNQLQHFHVLPCHQTIRTQQGQNNAHAAALHWLSQKSLGSGICSWLATVFKMGHPRCPAAHTSEGHAALELFQSLPNLAMEGCCQSWQFRLWRQVAQQPPNLGRSMKGASHCFLKYGFSDEGYWPAFDPDEHITPAVDLRVNFRFVSSPGCVSRSVPGVIVHIIKLHSNSSILGAFPLPQISSL